MSTPLAASMVVRLQLQLCTSARATRRSHVGLWKALGGGNVSGPRPSFVVNDLQFIEVPVTDEQQEFPAWTLL